MHLSKLAQVALPGSRRFSRALKVVTWQQPALCPSLYPSALSLPAAIPSFVAFSPLPPLISHFAKHQLSTWIHVALTSAVRGGGEGASNVMKGSIYTSRCTSTGAVAAKAGGSDMWHGACAAVELVSHRGVCVHPLASRSYLVSHSLS